MGPLLSAPAGASKRATPTSNLTQNTGSNLTEINFRRNKQERVLNRSHVYKIVRSFIQVSYGMSSSTLCFSFRVKFKSKTGPAFCDELNSYIVDRLVKLTRGTFCFIFVATPLLSWSASTGGSGILSLQWSRSKPSVFFVLDSNSNLHVW